jgi:cytoskeletal protein CcmA (bactofilin family)
MAIFGKKKEDQPDEPKPVVPPAPMSNAKKDKETAYFGKSLKVSGNVSGVDNLIILGDFEGEFDLKGQLKIAQGANIKGTIKANDISVNGNVEGTITANERIHLDNTARVKGQIRTPKISILEGAVFDGEIEMSRQSLPTPKSSAPGQSAPSPPAADKK